MSVKVLKKRMYKVTMSEWNLGTFYIIAQTDTEAEQMVMDYVEERESEKNKGKVLDSNGDLVKTKEDPIRIKTMEIVLDKVLIAA